jgi:hypothetical protein
MNLHQRELEASPRAEIPTESQVSKPWENSKVLKNLKKVDENTSSALMSVYQDLASLNNEWTKLETAFLEFVVPDL